MLAAILAAALTSLGGQAQESGTPSQPVTGPPIAVHENVEYGSVNGTDLHLDIYEPAAHAAELRPAVVLIHGGGWISFDKSTMRSMGNLLAGTVSWPSRSIIVSITIPKTAGQRNSTMCSARSVGCAPTRPPME